MEYSTQRIRVARLQPILAYAITANWVIARMVITKQKDI